MTTNHWIAVKQIKPEPGVHVIIYPDWHKGVGYGVMMPGGTWVDACINEQVKVTHWRPMPNPPSVSAH